MFTRHEKQNIVNNDARNAEIQKSNDLRKFIADLEESALTERRLNLTRTPRYANQNMLNEAKDMLTKHTKNRIWQFKNKKSKSKSLKRRNTKSKLI